MRKFGLAAILTFVDKGATAAMGRVGNVARRLQARFSALGQRVRAIGSNLRTMALASAPIGLAFGLMARKGAKFEQAIANVRSITLDFANKSTPALEGLAQTLGATTVFTATQAAEAMESLARAGLTTNQILGATEGALAAAAVEGINLADAADIVASNIKAFNLPAEAAAAIAGKLALVSARTNTNMTKLQEGLKLASPAAKLVGASLEQTTAVLGALADVGLKGTLSGTAFRSAITKLVNPTKAVRKGIGQLGLSFGDLRKKLDKGDVIGAFQSIVGGLSGVKESSKRAGIAMRIFGLRGVGIASALNLGEGAAARFKETVRLLNRETGETARAIAAERLKTVTGQLRLLGSAFEGVSIGLFRLIAPKTKGLVKGFAQTLGQLALAMRVVAGERFTDPKTITEVGKLSEGVLSVAQGISTAFSAVRSVVSRVVEVVGNLAEKFRALPPDTREKIAKVVTVGLALTAVLGPLVAGFGLFVTLAASAVGVFTGLAGALLSVPVALGAIVIATVGPTNAFNSLKDLFFGVKDALAAVGRAFMETGAFQSIAQSVGFVVSELRFLMTSIFGVHGTAAGWKTFGTAVGTVVSALAKTIAVLISGVVTIIDLAVKAAKFVGGGILTSKIKTKVKIATISDVLAGAETPRPVKDAAVNTAGLLPVSAGDVLLDRAALASAVTSNVRGGLIAPLTGGALGGGQPAVTSPPPAQSAGPTSFRIEVPVEISGRQVALAVAEVKLDDLERSGTATAAGQRSSLLQRGFAEAR